MINFIRIFRMKYSFRGCVLLIALCLLSVGWMYSKSSLFTYSKNTRIAEKPSNSILEEIIATVIDGTKDNKTYPLDINYFPESIRRKHEEEIRKVDVEKNVHRLKEMMNGEMPIHPTEFEDDFLKLFLSSTYYDVDRALFKLRNFLNLSEKHDYFFHNMSFDFTQDPRYRFVTMLPHRRKDGSVTIIFALAKWDPDEVPLEHLKKIFFMISIQQLRNPVTQASGFSMIYDFRDVGYRYIKYATPANLHLLQHVSFEAMPVRFIAYHLVNVNAIGNFITTIARPFLPAEIEKIFYTHPNVEELLDFYPSSMLPVQYGGNLTDCYAADWIRKANQQHGNFPPGGQKNTF